ncbi:MAG TPA: FAD-dependent oxidoreductase [Chlamydiales bacterium]|nr:FAD-dependent oxidoreductase [Chlamydiales bacterium]
MANKRIVILGGGFAGVYTAIYLEKFIKPSDEIEVALVNRENYFVYQPMLPEVVGGSLDILDTVSSIRKLTPKTRLFIREIDHVDLENKQVILSPQFSHKPLTLKYDHLVVTLGNVTDFRGMVGIHEHALPFKNLADALQIRNRIIEALEGASASDDPEWRRQLLSFVVGGGGFSGTEVVAEINDLVRSLAKQYPRINQDEISVHLIHSKDRLMERELSASLSLYAQKILQKRGVNIHFGVHLKAATPNEAILDNGEKISTKTIISTVPSSPNPIVETLNVPQIKGHIETDATMLVKGSDHLWSAGDCSAIPNVATGEGYCPPTAQFAIREAKVLAKNIIATIKGNKRQEFKFKALGMMGALGHHSAVAELFGKIKFSGLFAWIFWRMVYWMKLPGISRKIKVAFSWLLDSIIPLEAVQLKLAPSQGIAKLHFEPGEIIFHEGDIGDYLYIIVDGQVEVFQERDGQKNVVSTLDAGAYFGEMALLNQRTRSATVACTKPTNLLALRKSDFGMLVSNFAPLGESIQATEKERREKLES